MSYYVFHFLDGIDEPVFYIPHIPKTRFNLQDNIDNIMRPIRSGFGLIVTLFVALAFEQMENSPLTIKMFRKHSGKN